MYAKHGNYFSEYLLSDLTTNQPTYDFEKEVSQNLFSIVLKHYLDFLSEFQIQIIEVIGPFPASIYSIYCFLRSLDLFNPNPARMFYIVRLSNSSRVVVMVHFLVLKPKQFEQQVRTIRTSAKAN